MESYCHGSGQLVNLQKLFVIFNGPDEAGHLVQIGDLGAVRDSYLSWHLYDWWEVAEDGVQTHGTAVRDRLKGWQATTFSMIDRFTLIRSILSSIPVYLLANTVLPSSV